MADLVHRMHGEFVELCGCFAGCPRWIDRDPTEDRCAGAFG